MCWPTASNVNCVFHRSTADVMMGEVTVMIPCSVLHLMYRSYGPQFLTLKDLCVVSVFSGSLNDHFCV